MTLNEHDYLAYQLYTASKSPRVKKARLWRWIFTTTTLACVAFLFSDSDDTFLFYYFIILTLLSLTLYPFYSRWLYKRHYSKHIKETRKGNFDVSSEIEVNHDHIFTKDKTGEGKFNTSEIDAIEETGEHYFIKLGAGSIIIPKRDPDAEKLQNDLRSLIAVKGIRHNVELNWRWK